MRLTATKHATRRRYWAALLAFSVLGCVDRSELIPPPSTTTPEIVTAATSFLSVSDEAPAIGTEITIAATVSQPGNAVTLGSFRARLLYDATRLQYVGDVAIPGVMRAVNPDTGRVTLAGASAEGFGEGKLFALRFKVLGAQPFAALVLSIDELNGADYVSQLAGLRNISGAQLDRTLR